MHTQESQTGFRRRFTPGLLIGSLVGSLLAGGLGVYAHSWRGGWGGRGAHWACGAHRHGPADAKTAGHRAEFMAGWVLSKVEASDEQREQVMTIIQSAVSDLAPLREQHCDNRQAMLEALGQPEIDREALDQLRRSTLQLAETASSRLVDAIADAADVLTPEQRTQLLNLAERWRH